MGEILESKKLNMSNVLKLVFKFLQCRESSYYKEISLLY